MSGWVREEKQKRKEKVKKVEIIKWDSGLAFSFERERERNKEIKKERKGEVIGREKNFVIISAAGVTNWF